MDAPDHPLFAIFDGPSARALRAAAQPVRLADGEVLFHEDDPSDAVYAVLSGAIELARELPGGRFDPLTAVRAGAYFGELGVLDGSGRSAAARALGTCELLEIPGSNFLYALRRGPGEAALAVAARIVAAIRESNDRFLEHKLTREKLTLIGEMAGAIVHDLRGPFSGIRLAVDMIREGHAGDAETVELCDLVAEQSRRSLGMLDDLLQFARGVSRLDRQPTRVDELLQRFARLNREFAEHSRIVLRVGAPGEVVNLDADKMLRALQNLVNNAIEALAGRAGTIEITARRDRGRVEILVADDGPGIPEEIRSRVFEPFATQGKAGGTGLGMAIARAIVEAHGGSIAFTTEAGVGTTFSIRLPRAV